MTTATATVSATVPAAYPECKLWNADVRRALVIADGISLNKVDSLDDLNARVYDLNNLIDELASADPTFNYPLPDSGIVITPANVRRALFSASRKASADVRAAIKQGKAELKG